MTREALLRVAAVVVVVGAIALALLIPTQVIPAPPCHAALPYCAPAGLDHRWPLRAGIALAGLLAGVLLAAATLPTGSAVDAGAAGTP